MFLFEKYFLFNLKFSFVQFSFKGIKSVGNKIFYLRGIKDLTPINVQKDLFKVSGFMGLKRKLNISLINDFLKKARNFFFKNLIKEMEVF